MTPGILGLSHVSLSVRDCDAAKRFWVEVLGFEVFSEEPTHCFLFDRAVGLAVIISDHDRTVSGTFDEHNVGLDHLAYAVPSVEALLSWQQRLATLGVPHSPIVETDAGHHLNLRAPDELAIELYVMKPEFAAILGLADDAVPVAATHG
ncbi:catechol 2,3-dioxygenase-like lactoylglutathione lyase family enzyme [Kribbella sp. VKM Ac-2527]|uniref:Catechol 2,3-dioxygenase-like lactoylglutathione lyase family enzyme n=1 Tax=Kribbella caucasensis TaxID=2512215 RepID=A0A4R6K7R5_9ACTN|nr:VOC family protein [Kribbella sp. VKM Ac-2527]TDO43425.1 catechol 2,3-dioxygenase-like lactoylglutathione lyase family enzyme [Kribbella sp. VKM Ac-2527]